MKLHLHLPLVAALVAALASCEPPPEADGNDPSAQAIVNGQTETGWTAVGALTMTYPGYGYAGSFCTGTLIAPQWVLTAAHCLVEHEGKTISPQVTKFMVGTNANPANFGNGPISGTLYQADAFILHPNYKPNANFEQNDIGLVLLPKAVTGVKPVALNTTVLKNSWIGKVLFYVGFGVTDGINQGGSGIKRSASLAISDYYNTEYYSEYKGQGICFGDSGGPGLSQEGGQWVVVGVNSAVGGNQTDPCKGTYIDTRVDAFATWISGKISQPLPSCKTNAGMCFCAQACKADGKCDNTLCQTKTCEQAYDCLASCPTTNAACQVDCYQTGTSTAQAQMDALFACAANKCGSVPDSQYQTCMQNNCAAQIEACFPIPTGNLTCEQVYDCLGDCGQNQQCSSDCFGSGTKTAQDQLTAMLDCWDKQCGSLTDPAAYSSCVYSKCATQIDKCMPPANCPITGGGCPKGEACYPTSGGAMDCFTSNGKALDATCNASLTTALDCGDGLICINTGTFKTQCRKLCTSDGHCPVGEACDKPVFTNNQTVGVCKCIDGDKDGVCKADDCNDGDAKISPSKKEVCGNGVDDDCDGATDEDCDCTDADGDGYCEADDCHDGDAAIHPGATEKCGDNRDNDCDGQKDEGCDACTDADGDGYCVEDDCNDGDPKVHPDAAEVCENGRDDDCNGTADDGCGACVDGDGDGACLPDDCDDTKAAVYPGATEICDNGRDDDCDGAIDEGCGGGGGGGGDAGGGGGASGGDAGGGGGAGGAGGGGAGGGAGGAGGGSGTDAGGAGGSGQGANQPVIYDQGTTSGGCTSTRSGTAGPWLALTLAAIAFATRRRAWSLRRRSGAQS